MQLHRIMKPIILLGDMMLGRLVNEVSLPFPVENEYEDDRDINKLGMNIRHQIHLPNNQNKEFYFQRIYGDTLSILHQGGLKLGNLECCITDKSYQKWPDKTFHYRMNPLNTDVLSYGEIDFVCIANNHILDYGIIGATETIDQLDSYNIAHAGYGNNKYEAANPVIIENSNIAPHISKIMISSHADHGFIKHFLDIDGKKIETWASNEKQPGINYLDVDSLTIDQMDEFANELLATKQSLKADFSIVSCHVGPNWSWNISKQRRLLAQALIKHGNVDLIHGHSSHHIEGIEFIGNVPILYGCGAFVDDYAVDAYYRNDLSFIYEYHADDFLPAVVLYPIRISDMKVQRIKSSNDPDFIWLYTKMKSLCLPLNSKVELITNTADHYSKIVVSPINLHI